MRIATSIDIAAPRARVWDLLAGFDDYDRWNPLCKSMRGQCAEGSPLRFRLVVGGLRIPITAVVTAAVAGRELRWTGPGSALARRLGSGEHFFMLHDHDGGTRVEHGELFRGAPAAGRWFGGERALTPAYEALNRALKREAETTSIARG
jgi:hypothetical protein